VSVIIDRMPRDLFDLQVPLSETHVLFQRIVVAGDRWRQH
jgi:hypothetical protein